MMSQTIGINVNEEPQEIRPNCFVKPLIFLQLFIVILNEVQIWMEWITPFSLSVVAVQYILLVWFSLICLLLFREHQKLRKYGHKNLSSRGNLYLMINFLVMTHITCIISLVYIFWPQDEDCEKKKNVICLITTAQTALTFLFLSMYLALITNYDWTEVPTLTPSSKSYNSLSDQYSFLHPKRSQSRDPDYTPKKSVTSQPASPIIHTKRYEEYSMTKTKNVDHEYQVLRAERDRLRAEVNQINDEFAKFTASTNALRKEHENQFDVITKQKKKLRQLERDNTQLKVLNEVHKEANANAQKTIQSMSIPHTQETNRHRTNISYSISREYVYPTRTPD